MIAIGTNLNVYPCHGTFLRILKTILLEIYMIKDILNKINNHKNNLFDLCSQTCQKM